MVEEIRISGFYHDCIHEFCSGYSNLIEDFLDESTHVIIYLNIFEISVLKRFEDFCLTYFTELKRIFYLIDFIFKTVFCLDLDFLRNHIFREYILRTLLEDIDMAVSLVNQLSFNRLADTVSCSKQELIIREI